MLLENTGLFEMIVGVLTTCHTQYTWGRSICIFLFNRTTLHVFVTYLIGALYVHPLWFYKHQPMMIRCYLPGHLVLQMQPHVISFYGVTSMMRFMFLVFPASILELKVRIRTAIETITAGMLQTVWNELDYRVDVCRITKGTYIEHL